MQYVDSINDPRVTPYRNLRDRTLRGQSLFIAEGILLVERLLASRFEVASVFADEATALELAPRLDDRVPLYVGSKGLMKQVVGFDFHRGALAVGVRQPPLSVDVLLEKVDRGDELALAVCPNVTQAENLGLVLRSVAAFGLAGVVLGRRCCDPLSRRCLRVSMGGSLLTPLARADDMSAALRKLSDHRQLETVAAVLDSEAEPLAGFRFARRTALVFGNEFEGLEACDLAACQRRATVPMQSGTDSLNLGVAAGVFFYEWYCQQIGAGTPP